MKIELKENCVPVLGWLDMSADMFSEYLAEEVSDGNEIVFNTYKRFKEDEPCAFVLFKDRSKKLTYKIMGGTAKYLGVYPDKSAMLAYAFCPTNELKVTGIKSCSHCGNPEVVILKTKKL